MEKMNHSDASIILKRLIREFAVEEKIQRGHLIWNSLRNKPQVVTFENAINWNEQGELIFYLERQRELFKAKTADVKIFFENIEPWLEIDAYLFDLSYSWLTAFTHEDTILFLQH
ncbi:hypothetical protein [Paenibacillus aceris]|uniref:Uncharacterized protein n=1 Tax=Paenibacillus aceris TaxID=869555 RepID=A0ABS4I9F0_9BACL|nr:hypothetical protein [Paenibacillus aceris]MBP1967528.1 hypothetical protein [Paenibacillus aceris]